MNEDELRAVMRAHDAEAPRADELTMRPVHRRPALPIAAAVVVTAAVVAVIALVWTRPARPRPAALGTPSGQSSGSSAPQPPAALTCPKHLHDRRDDTNGWVPAKPQTPDAAKALVPNATPDAVVVCSYGGHFVTTGPNADTLQKSFVSGSRTLSGDLGSITRDLHSTARGKIGPCAAVLAPTDKQYYELGLLFHGKVLWVAAPGDHCQGTTNGRFAGKRNLGLDAQQAYRWGTWDTDPGLRHVCDGHPDAAAPPELAPNPTRVTVCERSSAGTLVLRSADAGAAARDYNAALDQGVAECALVVHDPTRFTIRFDYADGSTAFITGEAASSAALENRAAGCVFGPGGAAFAGETANSLLFSLAEFPFDR